MQRTIMMALFAGTALVALAACSDDRAAPTTQTNVAPQVQPQATVPQPGAAVSPQVRPQATGRPQPLTRPASGNFGPSRSGAGSTNSGLGSGTTTSGVSGSAPGTTGSSEGVQQPSGSAQHNQLRQQNRPVTVNLNDVRIDIARNLNLDASRVPVTIQLPVTAAANVCGLDVNALTMSSQQQGGNPTCNATNSTMAFQYVQNQIR
jgi:hypothetical protein